MIKLYTNLSQRELGLRTVVYMQNLWKGGAAKGEMKSIKSPGMLTLARKDIIMYDM